MGSIELRNEDGEVVSLSETEADWEESPDVEALIPASEEAVNVGLPEVSAIVEEAGRNLAASRQHMKRKYAAAHSIRIFADGAQVALKIPREDRAATDAKRLFCIVLGVRVCLFDRLEYQ